MEKTGRFSLVNYWERHSCIVNMRKQLQNKSCTRPNGVQEPSIIKNNEVLLIIVIEKENCSAN